MDSAGTEEAIIVARLDNKKKATAARVANETQHAWSYYVGLLLSW